MISLKHWKKRGLTADETEDVGKGQIKPGLSVLVMVAIFPFQAVASRISLSAQRGTIRFILEKVNLPLYLSAS